MARPNWNANASPIWPDGVYAFEVTACEEKVSKRTQDAMFVATLCALDFGRQKLCEDLMMLEGKGAGIGIVKLKALGFSGTEEEIKPSELVGRRGFCKLALEESEFTKDSGEVVATQRMKVCWDRDDGSRCGYWPESAKPDNVRVPSAAEVAAAAKSEIDDTPF